MGNYATTAELVARFESTAEAAWLTDDEATGVASTTDLDDAIESAEQEIDTRLSPLYLTPVVAGSNTGLAALLKRKTLDLAEYNLLSRKDNVSQIKIDKHDAAIAWADGCADGRYRLVGAAAASTISRNLVAEWSAGNRVLVEDSDRIFTRDNCGGL